MDTKEKQAETSAKGETPSRRPNANANNSNDKENRRLPVSSLTSKDIPMGQGSSTQGSKGHQGYMKFIDRDYKSYLALEANSAERKNDFAAKTLKELWNSQYVFRQKNKDTGMWEVVTEHKLLVGKIKQSFRDRGKKDRNSSGGKKRKEEDKEEEEEEEEEVQETDLAGIVGAAFARINGRKKAKLGAAVARNDKASVSSVPTKRADPRERITFENIGPYDVLNGRNFILLTGNTHFQRLAEAKKRRYKAAPKNSSKKESIAKEVIQETKKRGGRLIQKVDDDDGKEDIFVVLNDDAKWLEKTKQLLRQKENPNLENIVYEPVRSSYLKLPFQKLA